MTEPIEITKAYVGETVYGVPYGKNNPFKSLTKFRVIDVHRKYAELNDIQTGRADKFCVSTGSAESSVESGFFTGGFYWFDTLAGAEACETRREKHSRVVEFFNDYIATQKLTDNQVDRLHLVLFGGAS